MRNLSLFLLTPLAAACTSLLPPVVDPVAACSPESLIRYTGKTSAGLNYNIVLFPDLSLNKYPQEQLFQSLCPRPIQGLAF